MGGTGRVGLAALVLTLGLAFGGILAGASRPLSAPAATIPTVQALGQLNDAWSRGDYIAALTGYIHLLTEPDASNTADRDAVFETIALQTGELYVSSELARDGRNPKFSPDGRFLSYETGLEVSRRTHVIRNDASLAEVADLPGVSATFSPVSASVAYFRIADSPDIQSAAEAVERAALTAADRGALVQVLAWHVLRNSTIAIRDLDSGRELELPLPGMLKAGLVYAADGQKLFFLGRLELQEGSNDIYALPTSGGASQPVVVSSSFRTKGAPIVDRSGQALLFTAAATDLLRRPASIPAPSGVGPPADSPAPRPSLAIVDLASGSAAVRDGMSPALSADGSTLAYIVRNGAQTQLMVGPIRGEQTAVKTFNGPLDAPALSADGSRIAYQMMTRDDWEIYVADRDGRNETRLTRDMQHDLLPQFLGADRLLEVIGEPRHRRSFVLDLKTGVQTRLFHNNTVRTIAPEYQWVVSKDATRILIGAERDGNTVSPERGVYLMDLNRKISTSALLQRLEANLASERALRESQTRAFAPITRVVRDIVNRVSVDRIYAYEKALFDFDSKHISRPGNKRASEFLFNTYKSFGYDPEYQWFQPQGALDGRTANVIARLPGTVNPELVYVVSSHYDSVTAGPGADDDSSGTAALLEAARVMAGHPQPATIIFASFTGEEAGLLGSREFVRQALANKLQVVGALNNDMVGWANDAHLDNTIRYSNPGIRDIQHGAAMLFTRLITYDALYFKGTDAASYYDAYGDIVGGIGSYPVLSSPHYHQSHDLLEFENHDLIAETSKTTVATLMRLASSPSRIRNVKIDSVGDDTVTLSWAASPEKGVSAYVVSVLPPTPPGTAVSAGSGRSGSASALARSVTVAVPRATLRGIPRGSTLAVKAVNARGLESWDAARVVVE